MVIEHEPRAVRQRGRAIAYYIVVDAEPSPDLLLENYIWCLKQREMAAGAAPGTPRSEPATDSVHGTSFSRTLQGFNNQPV